MRSKLGVDVSKAKLDAALLIAGGKFRSKVFGNDGKGFASLLAWIDSHVPGGKAAVHVCLEATGTYHEGVAMYLHEQGIAVSVVNPLLVKRFAELNRLRNKTDEGDARCLARFCEMTTPELWQAPSPGVRALQALVGRLDTLMAMRQAELNRLEVAHTSVKPSIGHLVASLDVELEHVRSQIRQTIDDDPELKQRDGLLRSIPGLGDRTIPQLLAYIGRPERFTSVKALIAYASLSPLIRQSGSSLDQGKGTHPHGHHELKRALYYPALVAGRHNPLVAAFWSRLRAQNKPGKVIVVACMHKLLAIAYGVLKSNKPFDASHLKPQTA